VNRKKVKVWEERTMEQIKLSLNTMIAEYKQDFYRREQYRSSEVKTL
jgi:hypothetical protein